MSKLIVFEGIDGSGKTTQAKMLFEFLSKKGHGVYLQPHPSPEGTIGRAANQLLKMGKSYHSCDYICALSLVCLADMFNTADNMYSDVAYEPFPYSVITPDGYAYNIMDRYYLSTIIYQSVQYIDHLRELSKTGVPPRLEYLKFLSLLKSVIKYLPKPDIWFFIDTLPEIAVDRITKRDSNFIPDIENLSFQSKVRDLYRMHILNNKKIFVIGGSKSAEEIHQECIQILKKRKII